MNVLIFGLTGMLGHKIYQQLAADRQVFGTVRTTAQDAIDLGIFEPTAVIAGIDVTDPASIRSAIDRARPDYVINAVGLIKQLMLPGDATGPLLTNSVFPNRLRILSESLGFRLITISTDCVFAGTKGKYKETDDADAQDLYGLSKFLGEVTGANCLTIRTSMIGRELQGSNSIVEWFLKNRGGSVKGFTRAMYSGLTTIELARVIRGILDTDPFLSGLFHVAGPVISKFDLLSTINEHFDAQVTIEPDPSVSLDRTLDASEFERRTGYRPPAWDEMISRMKADPTRYEDRRG